MNHCFCFTDNNYLGENILLPWFTNFHHFYQTDRTPGSTSDNSEMVKKKVHRLLTLLRIKTTIFAFRRNRIEKQRGSG
jgi:hypothetical protein